MHNMKNCKNLLQLFKVVYIWFYSFFWDVTSFVIIKTETDRFLTPKLFSVEYLILAKCRWLLNRVLVHWYTICIFLPCIDVFCIREYLPDNISWIVWIV